MQSKRKALRFTVSLEVIDLAKIQMVIVFFGNFGFYNKLFQ